MCSQHIGTKLPLREAQPTQVATLQGVKQCDAEGRIVSAGQTSPALPVGSCGPQVLVVAVPTDAQSGP